MKFLTLNTTNGRQKEASTIAASTGAGDSGKIPGLDAQGKLDNSFMPTGIGAASKVLPAFEALIAGDFVNVFLDSGTVKVRKADASSNAKPANGFVTAAVASGANATVFYGDLNSFQTGLTAGSDVFLSATVPGKGTNVIPTTAGNIVQLLGRATSTTELLVEIQADIELA